MNLDTVMGELANAESCRPKFFRLHHIPRTKRRAHTKNTNAVMSVHPASQPFNQLRPVTIRDGSCYIR